MLQTQEQQHIIIYGTQQMHACTARTIAGRPCFKKGVHFIIILPPFSFDSPIWVDILGIVWMPLRFLCRVSSLEKRLVHVYDNIENEES